MNYRGMLKLPSGASKIIKKKAKLLRVDFVFNFFIPWNRYVYGTILIFTAYGELSHSRLQKYTLHGQRIKSSIPFECSSAFAVMKFLFTDLQLCSTNFDRKSTNLYSKHIVSTVLLVT